MFSRPRNITLRAQNEILPSRRCPEVETGALRTYNGPCDLKTASARGALCDVREMELRGRMSLYTRAGGCITKLALRRGAYFTWISAFNVNRVSSGFISICINASRCLYGPRAKFIVVATSAFSSWSFLFFYLLGEWIRRRRRCLLRPTWLN